MPAPEHGGRLNAAVRRSGRPHAQWLDLSTGINPQPWAALPELADAWLRLPEDDDGLVEVARAYYGAAPLLPVAGSQAAIQALPLLRPRARVAVLAPGYAEHAHRWRRAGHEVMAVDAAHCERASADCEVLVVGRPNNPGGACFDSARLLDWQSRLARRGGWLIADEAFIDAETGKSLVDGGPREGLIVLRSLGKFFGLAGARVGFVFAAPALLRALDQQLGPWALAGPSRRVAQAALGDTAWQAATRLRLRADGERLAALLRAQGLAPAGGCALFQWVPTPRAAALHEALAQQGVLARCYGDGDGMPASLRFGLPPASGWARLEAALQQARRLADTTVSA